MPGTTVQPPLHICMELSEEGEGAQRGKAANLRSHSILSRNGTRLPGPKAFSHVLDLSTLSTLFALQPQGILPQNLHYTEHGTFPVYWAKRHPVPVSITLTSQGRATPFAVDCEQQHPSAQG